MTREDVKILPHIIEIKERVAGIEQHLKTLNGSVVRQQKEIEERRKHSELNTSEINKIKITMAKWAGGAVVLTAIVNFIIVHYF